MTLNNLKITKYSIIKENKVFINGKLDFAQNKNMEFSDFIRSVYRNYKIGYPKFFKMDNLSKLGFITSELVFGNHNKLSKYNDEEIGVIIANSGSSLNTDIEYHNTIKDKSNYFPSPSVFVYTLPNILIGEICIRNKIKGESSFFIFEKFESDYIYNYINVLFNTSKVEVCLSGWVDFEENAYDSFLFLVEKENEADDSTNINFEPDNLHGIFYK